MTDDRRQITEEYPCLVEDGRCVQEVVTRCHHCGSRIREHLDEDGTPFLVEQE